MHHFLDLDDLAGIVWLHNDFKVLDLQAMPC